MLCHIGLVSSLAVTHPTIAAEWHPTRNGDLTPEDVTFGSTRKVWWVGRCGHEWPATIGNRVGRRSGCPFCANKKALAGFNDLATLHPDLSAEWHPPRMET